MIDECTREAEVVDAVESGRWPLVASELRAHAAGCPICRDVADVAVALREECAVARAEARVPSAGLVWWRAQLRARQRVAETASKPITVIHAIAGAAVAGVLFTLGGLVWPWLRASIGWVDQFTRAIDLGRFWLPFALAVGVWVVVAPLVLLVVLSDD